jgi:NAD(P)-dependent dehydrogenase (short-subunit alcohol dehydrogenase family)
MLRQKSGKIINIADSAAETPFPSYLPYSISKAGIITMTKGLAKVLAPHIQVNCIAPGPVLFPQNYDEKEKQFAIEQTLLKREGAPEDIVKALEFLIKNGDYITGTVLPVDGGRHIG